MPHWSACSAWVAISSSARRSRPVRRSPLQATSSRCCAASPNAQAATVVHSYAGAVWLTLAALADKQEVLVSRAEPGDIDSGRSLEQLAASAGASLSEVGTTNRTSAGDYEAAVTPRTAAHTAAQPGRLSHRRRN